MNGVKRSIYPEANFIKDPEIRSELDPRAVNGKANRVYLLFKVIKEFYIDLIVRK